MTAQKCNITQLLSNFDTGAVTTSSQRYGETAGSADRAGTERTYDRCSLQTNTN